MKSSNALPGFGPRHGPAEGFQIAEVVAKTKGHQRHDLPRHRIGGKAQAGRRAVAARQGLAVLGIKVPLPADRPVALHQQAGAPPHVAIEIFHPPGLFRRREGGELVPRTQEPVIGAHLDRQAKPRLPPCHHLFHPPVARLGHHQPVRPVPRHRARHLAVKAMGIGRIVQRDVIDAQPLGPQVGREMPHRRQKEDDLLLVMAHMGCLFGHLDHQDGIPRRVDVAQRRHPPRQVIGHDQPQHSAHRPPPLPWGIWPGLRAGQALPAPPPQTGQAARGFTRTIRVSP